MRNLSEIISEAKTKKVKVYRIIDTYSPLHGDDREYKHEGTLEELIQCFSYTLEVGESWQYERGNKKINRNPKNIQSLCDNLYNAKNNAARNGYGGHSYSWEEIGEVEVNPEAERDVKESLINESAADLAQQLRYFLKDKIDNANDKRYHSSNDNDRKLYKTLIDEYQSILDEINKYFDK